MLPLLALFLPPAIAATDLATAAAEPLVVTVPLSALDQPEEEPAGPPVALIRDALRVTVLPGDETAIDLVLDLDLFEAGPVALPIVGADLALSSATLDGRPVALPGDPGGWRLLVAELSTGRHRLRVRGTVATPRPELSLPITPATRARVVLAGAWDATVDLGVPAGDGAFDLLGAERLTMSWRPPAAPAPRPQVILAESATALRVDATGIEARAHVQLTVLHKATDRLQLRLPPVSDLDVQGPAVASFSQRGDLVEVLLTEPLDGRLDLSLSYRAAAPPQSGGPAPLLLPVTTSGRLEAGWVTVLAGDQGTVVPEAGRGLAAVPSAMVPAWGKGLVPGATVTSLALTGPRPELSLKVLDLTPAQAPGTFVDEARYEVAHASHGRALLRCRYQVRNDRNQYLGLVLPPGAVPLGVRVAGRVVQPVRAGDRLFIPLEKSVETLTGLVTFPVELSLVLPDDPWQRRGERVLSSPAVDAPVAHARWEIVLPPGVSGRRVEGRPTVVDTWTDTTRGLTIGRAAAVGSGTLQAEDEAESRRERSQDAWNSAYRAYQDNEFEVARGMLEQSLAWDQDNTAAQALLGNVDVLTGETGQQDDGQSRRIRAMARAKTQGLEGEQSKKKRKAEEAVRAGDYEQAYKELEELADLTEQLAIVEDTENVDQKVMLEDTRQQLAEIEVKVVAEQRQRGERQGGERQGGERQGGGAKQDADDSWAARTEFDFDGADIAGELMVPDGSVAVILNRSTGGPTPDDEQLLSLMRDELLPGKDIGSGLVGQGQGGGGYGAGVGGDDDGAFEGDEIYFDDVDLSWLEEELEAVGYVEGRADGYDEDWGDAPATLAPPPPPAPAEPMPAAAPEPRPVPVIVTSGRSYQSSLALDVLEDDDDVFGPIMPDLDPLVEVAARHDGPGMGGHINLRLGRGKRAASPPARASAAAPSHPLKPPPPARDPRTVPTAEQMDPAVTAAPLSVRPPRAGERLLLEQRLLAPDDALTITLTYRSTDS